MEYKEDLSNFAESKEIKTPTKTDGHTEKK